MIAVLFRFLLAIALFGAAVWLQWFGGTLPVSSFEAIVFLALAALLMGVVSLQVEDHR